MFSKYRWVDADEAKTVMWRNQSKDRFTEATFQLPISSLSYCSSNYSMLTPLTESVLRLCVCVCVCVCECVSVCCNGKVGAVSGERLYKSG